MLHFCRGLPASHVFVKYREQPQWKHGAESYVLWHFHQLQHTNTNKTSRMNRLNLKGPHLSKSSHESVAMMLLKPTQRRLPQYTACKKILWLFNIVRKLMNRCSFSSPVSSRTYR